MVRLIIHKKTFFPSCSAIGTLECRCHGRKQTIKSIVPGLIMVRLGYRCVLFFSLFYSILLVNVHSSRLKNITVYFKQIYTHLVQCLTNSVNFFLTKFLHFYILWQILARNTVIPIDLYEICQTENI